MSLIDWLIPDTPEYVADEMRRAQNERKNIYRRSHYYATRFKKKPPRPPIKDMRNDRYEALMVGDRFYYDGKPCVHGHLDARYSKSGVCVTCAIQHSMRYHRERMEKKERAGA